MAKTLNSNAVPMGVFDANGKPVTRKPAHVEEKKEPQRDEAAEHRAAMLTQAKSIADVLAQNAELLEAVHSLLARPAPVREVDAWEFTIERDNDGLAKMVLATPKKTKV